MEKSQKTWEESNNISLVDPSRDALYNLDADEVKSLIASKPWKQDPDHFKNVRISAVALLKMVMHARSGGDIEVMGLMLGVIHGDSFIITDSFRLPVEGTETRVNAQDEANEYMVQYLQRLRDSGRNENPVGWYHSHPGYGCWLSGIDVSTQSLQQSFNEPFLAVVIDPVRTMSDGKVEIGAFRAYPEGHKATNKGSHGEQMIPQEKVGDFGIHADKYYSLEVSYFKSTLDTLLLANLWNKYWVSTLSSNPLLDSREYGTKRIHDLASKIEETRKSLDHKPRGLNSTKLKSLLPEADPALNKLAQASQKVEYNQQVGLISGAIKDEIFQTEDSSR